MSDDSNDLWRPFDEEVARLLDPIEQTISEEMRRLYQIVEDGTSTTQALKDEFGPLVAGIASTLTTAEAQNRERAQALEERLRRIAKQVDALRQDADTTQRRTDSAVQTLHTATAAQISALQRRLRFVWLTLVGIGLGQILTLVLILTV